MKGHYMNSVIGIFDDLFLYVSAIDSQSFIFNFIGQFDLLAVQGNIKKKTKTLGYDMGKGSKLEWFANW